MDLVKAISILEKIFDLYGLPVVFFSSFVEMSPFGWAIPGGLIVAIATFFSFGEITSLVQILVFGWLGSWITFLLAYFLGYKTGYKLVKKYKKEESAERAKRMLKNHGGTILTTSMLAGLTRFWVAFVAGSQKYNFLNFFFYSSIASLTWTSLQVAIGFLAGSERDHLEKGIGRLGIISWFFLGLALFAIYRANKKEYKETIKEK